MSPGGKHKNQIDHELVKNSIKIGITNVGMLREADADSAHLLKGIWIRVKFKKHCNHLLNAIERYDIEKLEDDNKRKN